MSHRFPPLRPPVATGKTRSRNQIAAGVTLADVTFLAVLAGMIAIALV